MSLLLDALKKAAKDKKKSADAIAPDNLHTSDISDSPFPANLDDDSLELDLELDHPEPRYKIDSTADDEDDTSSEDVAAVTDVNDTLVSSSDSNNDNDSASSGSDDFPEVDDNTISSHIDSTDDSHASIANTHQTSTASRIKETTNDEPEIDEPEIYEPEIDKPDIPEPQISETEPLIEPDTPEHSVTASEVHNKLDIDTAATTDNNTKASPDDEIDVSTSSIANNDITISDPPQTENSNNTITNDQYQKRLKSIQNEQALSALINQSNKHSHRNKLKRNIFIVVFILTILSASAVYYYLQMSISNQDLYLAQDISEDNSQTINRSAKSLPPGTDTQPKPVTRPATKSIVSPVTTTTKPSQIVESSLANKTTTDVIPVDKEATQSDIVSSIATPTRRPAATPKPARIKNNADKKPISIQRQHKPDPIKQLINDAYAAFHRNELNRSNSLYHQALQREEKNRDALLGLAAIAVRELRFDSARDYYQYLLKLNPKDSLALSGLSNLHHTSRPDLDESQLKLLLKEQPQSSHLHFSLGNLYAAQKRWPEAQSSFFNAWAADNTNADFSYNLAVSLDHLGKHKQALHYYQLSLTNNQASTPNFSADKIRIRIQALQESLL